MSFPAMQQEMRVAGGTASSSDASVKERASGHYGRRPKSRQPSCCNFLHHKVHIICIGNPGCGKSTLLNSMIGRVVFKSGFNAGCGLTKECEKYEQGPVTYVDTPGLADARGRERAASAISEALNANARCKILFATTLEAGQVRPEDHATMALVLEALLEAGISDRCVAVVVNKVRRHDMKMVMQRGFKFEKLEVSRSHGCCQPLAGIFGGRPKMGQPKQLSIFLSKIMCVEEDFAIEDQDEQLLELTQQFTSFIASMPSVFIRNNDIANIQHDRFEILAEKVQQEIHELSSNNHQLRDELMALQHANAEPLQMDRAEPASVELAPKREDRGLQKGDTVILIDAFYGGAQLTMQAGEHGQVVLDRTREGFLSVKFDTHADAVIVPQEKLCASWQVPSFKDAVVRELAYRGIELGAILEFYASLGRNFMMNFNPEESTTFHVVRDAIVPQTRATGLAYASQVHQGRRLAERMVSHTWGNRFAHTVAAVVADAFDEPIYHRFLNLLAPQKIEGLIEDLRQQDKLTLSYWICPFSVNQHRSICKGEAFQCPCASSMHDNKSPLCEMDQFDKMMGFMFQARSQRHRQVIAIDKSGEIFQRAWVVAELVEVLISIVGLEQAFKAFDEDTLNQLRSRGDVKIHDCQASRPEDKVLILDKANKLMAGRGLTDEVFHKNLNERIFEALAATGGEVQKMKKQHILFIGNEGVGKTTILNSLIGNAAFVSAGNPNGVFHELEHDGRVFLKAKGLADTSSRERAAKAITSALMRDGKYTLFFIVTLDAGRVRPQDKETMQLVLLSASKANIKHNYTVIINKATRHAIQKFQQRAELDSIRQQFTFGCEVGLLPSIRWIERVLDGNLLHLPVNLLTDAPCLHIRCSRVEHVQHETAENKLNMKIDERDSLARENHALEEKVRDAKKTKSAFSAQYQAFANWIDGHSFYFLDARKVRESSGPLRKFQDLIGDGWLNEHSISIKDVMAGRREDITVVSYDWLTKLHPDPLGEYAAALRQFLLTQPSITHVWMDWSCIPQPPRTTEEVIAFAAALKCDRLLYLHLHTLVLLTPIYVERFLPLLDVWCSFQSVGPQGLFLGSNFLTTCIPAQGFVDNPDACEEAWGTVKRQVGFLTVEEMCKRLADRRFSVTNEKDRSRNLETIRQLHANMPLLWSLAVPKQEPIVRASLEVQ